MTKRSLEQRIQRLEDIHEIQNLMARYEYLHTAGMHKECAELFALKSPDVRTEIGDWGVWEGAEGIKRLYPEVHEFLDGDRVGKMEMFALTTPIIEVAGDGKTAKALWIAPGLDTGHRDGKLRAFWGWAKLGVDLIKEDGKWKIWHYHVYGIFFTPYEESWVESSASEEAPFVFPDELKPDRPTTYHWMYHPMGKTENVPPPPEPYETFDDEGAY